MYEVRNKNIVQADFPFEDFSLISTNCNIGFQKKNNFFQLDQDLYYKLWRFHKYYNNQHDQL